jgi:hypothetical protein
MTTADHFRTTASALGRWAVAQLQDSIAVGILWLIGLCSAKDIAQSTDP